MPGRQLPVVALLFAIACGGVESPLGVQIAMNSQALIDGLVSASVRLYASEADCAEIELSGHEISAVYESSVSVDASAVTGRAEIETIVEGEYVLVVWGFDSRGAAIGFACKRGVLIENGKQTLEVMTLGEL